MELDVVVLRDGRVRRGMDTKTIAETRILTLLQENGSFIVVGPMLLLI
jgi:hypothetical protein